MIWLYGYIFDSMKEEKRRQRAYKCTDKVYEKARKKAKQEGTTIANAVEDFLTVFGNKGDWSVGWKSVPEQNKK